MQVEILHRPAYALAVVKLDAGEQVKAEAGAMVSMDTHVKMETQSGGLGKGLKRMLLGGESFFQNTFTAEGQPGEVTFAPTLPGDIIHRAMDGEWIIQGSSYLASTPSIEIDSKFGGFKGFFSGEGLFMLKATGKGDLIINSFGAIHEIDVDGEYIVDTGHIVAFESTLDYKINRVGGWKSTILSGEGLVCRFSGKGRLWIQTRNGSEFGKVLGPLLPEKSR